MTKIYIKYMSDSAIATIKANSHFISEKMKENPDDNQWLFDFLGENPFVEKRWRIDDFSLKTSKNGNYKDVDYDNSITLYEGLKDLPGHVLGDERFWCWLNFDKFYNIALQAMPITTESTLNLHYTFSAGTRRGIFFGVLSRSYFRVALTIDESLEDKYEYSKFTIENPERFRNLTWRTFSSNRNIVIGTLKAEKKYIHEHGEEPSTKYYKEIVKRISEYGSVTLLDANTEDEISDFVYNQLEELAS
jgi:hypothetical protein